MKSKILLKAKKNIATKISKSKLGEKLIKKNLGEDGWRVFLAMIDCITSVRGKDVSLEWRNRVFKFAIKTALFHENKTITQQEMFELKIPLETMSISLANVGKAYLDGQPKNKLMAWLEKYKKASENSMDQIYKLIGPHITQKNRDILKETIKLLSDDDFFEMIQVPENKEKIKVIVDGVYKIHESGTYFAMAHKTMLSNSIFSDQYGHLISTVKSIWKRLKSQKNFGDFDDKLIEKMGSKSENYEKEIKLLKNAQNLGENGSNEQKKGEISEFLGKCISMLEIWDENKVKIDKKIEKFQKWENFQKKEIILADFFDAFVETLNEMLEVKLKSSEEVKLRKIINIICLEI